MSIRIYLNNRNAETSEIRIYRSTSRIDENTLPEPVAVLPGNARYYDEPNYLFYDVDYHYRIAVVDSTGQVVLSPNQIKRLGLDVGPGPSELMYGDENLGIFGIMRSYESNDILEAFKAIPITLDHSTFRMLKYIRKGVINYVPTATINIRGDLFSNANLVKGLNTNPTFSTNGARFYNGNETVSGDRKFSWHLPVIMDDAKEFTTITDTSVYNFATSPAGFSEAIDLYRMIHNSNMVKHDKSMSPAVYQIMPTNGGPMYCADNVVNGTSSATITTDVAGTTTTISQTGWNMSATGTNAFTPILTYEGKA